MSTSKRVLDGLLGPALALGVTPGLVEAGGRRELLLLGREPHALREELDVDGDHAREHGVQDRRALERRDPVAARGVLRGVLEVLVPAEELLLHRAELVEAPVGGREATRVDLEHLLVVVVDAEHSVLRH
jgi:hypothetical protein